MASVIVKPMISAASTKATIGRTIALRGRHGSICVETCVSLADGISIPCSDLSDCLALAMRTDRQPTFRALSPADQSASTVFYARHAIDHGLWKRSNCSKPKLQPWRHFVPKSDISGDMSSSNGCRQSFDNRPMSEKKAVQTIAKINVSVVAHTWPQIIKQLVLPSGKFDSPIFPRLFIDVMLATLAGNGCRKQDQRPMPHQIVDENVGA